MRQTRQILLPNASLRQFFCFAQQNALSAPGPRPRQSAEVGVRGFAYISGGSVRIGNRLRQPGRFQACQNVAAGAERV